MKKFSKADLSPEFEEKYSLFVGILDQLLGFNREVYKVPIPCSNWRQESVAYFIKQSIQIMTCILKNTKGSNYENDEIVEEPIITGALGRIISDIYIKILYLNVSNKPDDQMKLCWEYQSNKSKISVTEFEFQFAPEEVQEIRNRIQSKVDFQSGEIKKLKFKTKGEVLSGKNELMLQVEEIGELKGFNAKKFKSDYNYFSKFTHASAFSLNMAIVHKSIGVLTPLLDKIVANYIGLTYEALVNLYPKHEHMDFIAEQYSKAIKKNWE